MGQGYQVVNRVITDANGTLETAITVPKTNNAQEQWTVVAITIGSEHTVQAASQPFTISQ